jgi:diguanylate cyclase (GGDEF)-like protein
MTTPSAVNGARQLELVSVGLAVGRAATMAEACRIAAQRVSELSATACAIRSQFDADWRTVAQHGTGVDDLKVEPAVTIPLHGLPVRTELLVALPAETAEDPENGAAHPLHDPDWRDALGGIVAAGLQLVSMRAGREDTERRTAAVERLSRALIGIADSSSLHRTILDHMASAVGAEIGAVAIYQPQDNTLAISATHGYPAVLVEHVRLAPGEGVLGRVFASGQSLLAASIGAVPGQVARRRYRTDSFVAVPLKGHEGVVAIVSLTDKTAGARFTPADLSLLELMAIPAALAVSRELLRDRTNDLAHLATVDALTGLFNRRYFETRLEQELQRQRRQRQFDELSLLMLDLDNFKELNDTQGHLVGDLALKEVAEILRRAVRIFDVCARYGGEEFVILMPGAASSTALRIAERIRRQVEQHFATGLRSNVPVPLTVSIGVSTASLSVTRDALVAQADSALLRATGTGKNQVNLHQDGAPDPPPA